MQTLFNIINVPLGYVMRFLADIFNHDFAAAVAVFTLLINLILIPLSIKSQKSSVQQMRIKPKMDELRKRYGDDRQKMAEAQQKLYQDEGVSMSGGCLPMVIRMLLMFSIYWLIMSPLTYMAGAKDKNIDNIYNTIVAVKSEDESLYKDIIDELGWQKVTKNNVELAIVGNLRQDGNIFEEVLPKETYSKIKDDVETLKGIDNNDKTHINFYLFGNKNLDLTKTPKFSFNIFKEAQLLWLIPICAFLAQILTSLISVKINKINNPDAPSMMGMLLTMPLISLFIGFGLPGGVGFYWICSSLIGGLIQSGVQLWYGPKKLLARERAKELGKQCDFEAKQLEKFKGTVE